LVSNAVRHAPYEPDGGLVLEIEREPGVVRIIVRDGGSHVDLNEATFHTQSDGHFGPIFRGLGDQWGFSIDGDKGVWFDFETGSRPQSPLEPDPLDMRHTIQV
jgi:hypothetical protein